MYYHFITSKLDNNSYLWQYSDVLFRQEFICKKKSTIRLIFAVLLLTFGITTQAEIKTIKDVLGREVNVDVPVKNAVLGFYYPDYIAVTDVENFKYVKGISREFWENLIQEVGHCFLKKCLNSKILLILVM